MFRIAFEPKGGFFKLQFQNLGMFWSDVRRQIDCGDKSMYEVLQFRTYAEARRHVESTGLPQAFNEQGTKPPVWISGYGAAQAIQSQGMLELR